MTMYVDFGDQPNEWMNVDFSDPDPEPRLKAPTTPTPTRWDMFGVWEGDVCVARPGDEYLTTLMDELASRMRAGTVGPHDLYDAIRIVMGLCTAAGFGEVYDTEPQWHITDFVNAVCDELGWAHIDRWEI